MKDQQVINIPNILTILRIVLIPVFIISLLYERYHIALFVFVVAAVTDLLDGLIARASGQTTELGSFLDPLADKFLLVSSFVLFTIHQLVPIWLTVTIISRDVIVVTGWVVLFFITGEGKVEPSIWGKISNALQLILLAYILLGLNVSHLPEPDLLIYITAVFTIVSGIHYIYRGIRQ
ncbi:MAG: CDP-diacylglycerol--glycerol-3-phosphate 3-phosphatidyltransferase [Nitrospirae bacterium]|nr:MAG: CDP-diacylglycerol--glycerol-3-phosphate 3-phosphatidyltransferase [Nitrospirota bacterium]